MQYLSGYKDILPTKVSSKHRRFYKDIEKWYTGRYNICILLGPRKVGKTYALAQFIKEHQDITYVDFKQHAGDTLYDILDFIQQELLNEHCVVLDEITYCKFAEIYLAKFASLIVGTSAKLLITGSQQETLQQWSSVYFCTNAMYVNTSFLDFEEFLVLTDIIPEYNYPYVPSSEDFFKYVTESATVLGILDNTAYLKGCLEETLQSHVNSSIVLHTDCIPSSDVNKVTSLMYVLLAKLAKKYNRASFMSVEFFISNIWSGYKGPLSFSELSKRIRDVFDASDYVVQQLSVTQIKMYLRFLYECHIITFVTDTLHRFDVFTWLYAKDSDTEQTNDFFEFVDIYFKHPIFYYNLVKALLPNECEPEEFICGDVLGGILECYIRNLWSAYVKNDITYTYRNYDNKGNVISEVDIIDEACKVVMEISVRDKSKEEVHLGEIPAEYTKILFTKTRKYITDKNYAKPYPALCLDLVRRILST